VYRLFKGVKISISTDRNVNNEFIPGYSKKKYDILDPGGPRKSDAFFGGGKEYVNNLKVSSVFYPM
jgi:hypothetical protein